ncbi:MULTISPECIES: hypothetical protein [unclassified Sphingomonas]|uniref:hypothetical protein n=1 Tax=unclassified Sphingomonas TaxID=196159 RepID=UPI000FF67E6F|nr:MULTISPECIES: hypothetical protein [unclassified Sphingomonas]RKE53418.1 hypothetical protein C8J39_0562 [Sphingomonas sp. PP-CC-1A-547]TCM09913.1 hypothetical protein C8J41_101419 [Sphingomonas sp. PP-CC-3G-468]
MHKLIVVAALCTLPTAIAAQDAPTDAAIVVPAHTEMVLRLDEEIASDRARVGQTVAVSVARDVIVDGAVLIPRGAPGVGAVTFRTGKGAFGKSGKLDIELRSVEVGGRSVPVVGRYHAAGDGRTGETIGTIIVGGVVAGAFVTGHNAVFEEGRQFTAFTGEATRIARPAIRMARYAPLAVPPAMSFTRSPALVSPSYATVAYSPPAAMAIPPAYVADGSFAQKLAAAQPVRGGDSRLGWTISD